MAINKVEYGEETLIDLTNDTVDEQSVLEGRTFHAKDGTVKEGKVVVAEVIDNLTSTSTTDALSANQGRVLNENKLETDLENIDEAGIQKLQDLAEQSEQIGGVIYKVNHLEQFETDPTVPSHVKSITTDDISKWNDQNYASLYVNDIAPLWAGMVTYAKGDLCSSNVTLGNKTYRKLHISLQDNNKGHLNLTDNIWWAEYIPTLNNTVDTLVEDVEVNTNAINDNWQGKGYNLIPYPYLNPSGVTTRGITYTYTEDGTIIANGTVTESTLDSFFSCGQNAAYKNSIYYTDLPAGTYRISNYGDESSDKKHWVMVFKESTEIARDTRNNGIFTVTEVTRVFVQCRVYRQTTVSNLIFKPMLVKVAEDGSYPTEYQRYAQGNVALTDEIKTLMDNTKGSYNLIGFPYCATNTGQFAPTVTSSNGIAVTSVGDGSLTIKGTKTGGTDFGIYRLTYNDFNRLEVEAKQYMFIPGIANRPTGLSYQFVAYRADGTYQASYFGEITKFDNSTGEFKYVNIMVWISSTMAVGTVVDTVSKPMLVEIRADGTYPTEYQQYAKGNLELSNYCIDLTGRGTDLIEETKKLASKRIMSATFFCSTDGGTSNIANIPEKKSFTCEAVCKRWASPNDYMYAFTLRNGSSALPYVSGMIPSYTELTWHKLTESSDVDAKVSKSGDTMTGSLDINGGMLNLHKKGFNKGTVPTSNQYESINYFEQTDTNATKNRLGVVESRIDTAGATRLYMGAYQNVADASDCKLLGVHYGSDGTSYAWTDADKFRTNKLELYDGANYVEPMSVYDEGSTAGSELAITANGNTFIGGGESARGLRTAFQTASNIKTGEAYGNNHERTYIVSDGETYIYSGANTVANRKGVMLDNNGVFRPAIQGQGINLGSSNYPYNNVYGKNIYAVNTDGKDDIFLSRDKQPTETTNGETRIRIGYPSYTNADNKTIKPTKGKLDIRSSGGGYVNLTAKDTLTSSTGVNVELPATAGTLALDTTATTSANGLMSAEDKTKLNSAITGTLDSTNSYYEMTTPDGSTANFIRTTSNGFIPNQAGGAGGGHASIGTSTWRFKNVYTDNLNGTDVSTLATKSDLDMYKAEKQILTCSTAGNVAAKTVDCEGFVLNYGARVVVKFVDDTATTGISGNLTLNVNNTGAYRIVFNANGNVSTIGNTNGYFRNNYCQTFVFINWSGTDYWLCDSYVYNSNDVPYGYCTTAAGTAAKTAAASGYSLTTGQSIPVRISTSNTVKGALTMNINSKGAKPIYINGSPSSATNYTLPAGIYDFYYDGTNYQVDTRYGHSQSSLMGRKAGGKWVLDRETATVYNPVNTTGGYNPVTCSKTTNGSWSMGALTTSDNLIFNYTTDSNYNSGSNVSNRIGIEPPTISDSYVITDEMIGNIYNSATSYATGTLCVYHGKLWKALKTAKGQTPSSTSTYWAQTTLLAELGK